MRAMWLSQSAPVDLKLRAGGSIWARFAPICIINFNPIGYILKLEDISYFFEDNILLLASVIIRSIIQGHPLQDGNKRLGMFLGTYFLEKNGILITATDEAFFETAMEMACGKVRVEQLYCWLQTVCSTEE